jgi:hypothetical protein
MRGRTVAHIFETIENLEQEIALLKALVQQAISKEEIGPDSILVDAEYFEETEQEISPSHRQSPPQRRNVSKHINAQRSGQRCCQATKEREHNGTAVFGWETALQMQ